MEKLSPKKHLGQHFLTDKQLAQKIVRTLQATQDSVVAEIGPGMGVLTQYLLPLYPQLRVVEVDPDAVNYLKSTFPELSERIIFQDVLKWNPAATLLPDSFLIGNLPYNISSPIFFHIIENRKYVKEGVFMIQKEVAERICAAKGNKTYGILSVLLQYYFDIKYEFSVPPSVFSPPPKVMSAVIRMVRKDRPEEEVDFSVLKNVVKTAFNQRRKTLRNALKPLVFESFEGDEHLYTLRAEALGIPEFITLAKNLKKES
ncbi:MAG: 16S rRNA (adenine(1518)-N(6)/adenine(1519)-N(6))-dimethyltransferase RsmA [Bacteroidia bacterium]|nr:16S rRNA (adenine(1518)-N(6)/adenine(1519)-N(6))-dimethyltransferase RsmA [Bacteroidia bacterium]